MGSTWPLGPQAHPYCKIAKQVEKAQQKGTLPASDSAHNQCGTRPGARLWQSRCCTQSRPPGQPQQFAFASLWPKVTMYEAMTAASSNEYQQLRCSQRKAQLATGTKATHKCSFKQGCHSQQHLLPLAMTARSPRTPGLKRNNTSRQPLKCQLQLCAHWRWQQDA
jgi:hypothetical protein